MMVLYFRSENKVCKLVDELLQESENDVYVLDVATHLREVDRYNICTTPTLVFMSRDGEELGRLIPTQNFKIN